MRAGPLRYYFYKYKQLIESRYRHDYRIRKCGSVSVDGGRDYLRQRFTFCPQDNTALSVIKISE